MNRVRLPKQKRCHACRCIRTAVTQGLALDALLLLGLCGATLSNHGSWTTTFTVVASTGIGKTVVSGVVAALKCWSARPLGIPPEQR